MKKIIPTILSCLLFCFLYNVSILADEENAEQIVGEVVSDSESSEVITVQESVLETTEVEMDEPILTVQEVYTGWNNNHTQYFDQGKAVDGLYKIDNNYYLFNNRTLNTQFTGLAKGIDSQWYFVRDGKSDWTFTGVAQSLSNGKWYHAKNGKLDWNFTGWSKSVADNNYYFSKNGTVDRSFTGVAKSVSNGKWYHGKNGKLDCTFTGLSKSVQNNKYYFSRKGQLDWSFTGLAKSVSNGKWYHAKKGELDWSFTGLSKSVENNKWYYSSKGALDWSYTGVAKSIQNNQLYYVKKGALDWGYTGLSKDTSKNYYYVKKGSVLTSGNTKTDKAMSWALTKAMNNYHGYSQSRRMSGRDFDCSSFVYYSLINAGYSKKLLGDYAFTTYNIASILKGVGYKQYNYNSVAKSLKPGDLLLSSGHVEIYIGDGKTVGAHYPDAYETPGDQNGKEISIENLSEFFLNYTTVLRI